MRPSEACYSLIRQFEGMLLNAYADPGGIWTIGYGHTKGVREGMHCSLAQANVWLEYDAAEAAEAVNRLVTADLTQHQFDALTDFVFNLGSSALEASTLLRKLNAGDYEGAADEFPRWVYDNHVKLPGLVKRREAERALFLS